jgi:hypothetical protein
MPGEQEAVRKSGEEINMEVKKESYPRNRPWRPIGL